MVNYREAIQQFHKMLQDEEWPRIVFIPPEDYWAIIIASEGAITADWHFDGKEEDEGFAFFVIGPTMVRPCKRRSNTVSFGFTGLERRKPLADSWKIPKEENNARQ